MSACDAPIYLGFCEPDSLAMGHIVVALEEHMVALATQNRLSIAHLDTSVALVQASFSAKV